MNDATNGSKGRQLLALVLAVGAGSGLCIQSGGTGRRRREPSRRRETGGDGATAKDGHTLPYATMKLVPPDGTTAAAGKELALTFSDTDGYLTTDVLEQLQSGVVLATWPEKAALAATAVTDARHGCDRRGHSRDAG